jgi:hypothetical protein
MSKNTTNNERKAQKELECAIVYLESILRAESQHNEACSPEEMDGSSQAPSSSRSGAALTLRGDPIPSQGSAYLVSVARQFINDSEVLQKYVPAQTSSSAEEAPPREEKPIDPRIVLALSKADLARRRTARRSLAALFYGDGAKETGIRSLVLTAICGIVVAAATSVFNSHSEIKARWAEEVYSGRRQFLQETINRLTDAQGDAQKLALFVRQAESGGTLQMEDLGLYRESLDTLRKKNRQIMAALQAQPRSDLRFSQLRTFYELEALDVCLRKAQGGNDGSEALKKWIELNREENLSPEQVDTILREADTSAPCGQNFNADVMDDLIYRVAEQLWTLNDDATR